MSLQAGVPSGPPDAFGRDIKDAQYEVAGASSDKSPLLSCLAICAFTRYLLQASGHMAPLSPLWRVWQAALALASYAAFALQLWPGDGHEHAD
jgi:hypothetical protein